MPALIVALLTLAAMAPMPFVDSWFYRQIAGFSVLIFLLSTQLAKKFHWSVGLSAFVFLTIGSVDWIFPAVFYGHIGPIGQQALCTHDLTALFTLLLFAGSALALHKGWLDIIMPNLAFIGILDSLVMIYRGLRWGYFQTYWVMENSSLDGSFLVVLLPLFIWRTTQEGKFQERYLTLLLFLAAIFLTKSNTAILGVGVVTLAFALSSKIKNKWSLLLGMSTVVGLGSAYMKNKFLASEGRFEVWKMAWEFWSKSEDQVHWFGSGPGSYWIYGPTLQAIQSGMKDGTTIFPWLHNDWFQVLFETGIVGLVSIIILYLFLLKKSWKNPVLFSMVVGYGFVAFTQFPTHLFFFQLLGVGLVHECFSEGQPFSFTATWFSRASHGRVQDLRI